MMSTAAMLLLLAMIALALVVDLAQLIGWLRGKR
jgi:hypothetical protein